MSATSPSAAGLVVLTSLLCNMPPPVLSLSTWRLRQSETLKPDRFLLLSCSYPDKTHRPRAAVSCLHFWATVQHHLETVTSLASARFQHAFCSESHQNCSSFPDFKPIFPKTVSDGHSTLQNSCDFMFCVLPSGSYNQIRNNCRAAVGSRSQARRVRTADMVEATGARY
jgi:hypothetical protein